MSVIESPSNELIQQEVDQTYRAARVSLLPRDFVKPLGSPPSGGHYRLATVTGLTTVIAANGGLLSMRWIDAQLKFILQRIQVAAVITTAFGTAQEISVNLAKLINFTTADSGGTALIPINDNYKKKTSMTNSIISDLRVATTGALTNGTGTAQSNSSSLILPTGNAIGGAAMGTLFNIEAGEEYPIELVQNEGFRIRIQEAQGATGVVRFHFVIDWAEVPNV